MIVDACGLECPEPLLLAKKALDGQNNGEAIEVYVDNEIALQNLEKLAVHKKLPFESRRENNLYCITIRKE